MALKYLNICSSLGIFAVTNAFWSTLRAVVSPGRTLRYATKREKPLSAQPFPSLIKPPFSAIDEQLIFVKKQVKALGHFLTLITAALRRACYEFALFQSLSQLFVPTYFVKCRRTKLELKY